VVEYKLNELLIKHISDGKSCFDGIKEMEREMNSWGELVQMLAWKETLSGS
jgi:hypothetical protein